MLLGSPRRQYNNFSTGRSKSQAATGGVYLSGGEQGVNAYMAGAELPLS